MSYDDNCYITIVSFWILFFCVKPIPYKIHVFSRFRALIGEVDEDLDSRLDLENIRAEPLNECKT